MDPHKLSPRSARATQEDSREHTGRQTLPRKQPTTHKQASKQANKNPDSLEEIKKGRENTRRSYQSSSLSGVQGQLSSSQRAEPETRLRCVATQSRPCPLKSGWSPAPR